MSTATTTRRPRPAAITLTPGAERRLADLMAKAPADGYTLLLHSPAVATEVAMRKGAPVGLVFQSLAGSQKGNESFGINVEMLDEAHALAKRYSVVTGPN